MKRIAILGVTGSIGKSACEVVRSHPNEFRIVFASSHSQVDQLFEIQREFSIPKVVSIKASQKKTEFEHIYYGEKNLISILRSIDCDIILNAISGSAGLPYSMISLERGITLALANKESMVMAGHILNTIAQKNKVDIIPVDSEHSAIFQAIGNHSDKKIRKLVITASGGPFRTIPLQKFSSISVQESLYHPTWNMGAKITVDSATMMNKGLEVIEAHWLFHKPYQAIQAVIHPQSIIHSFVEFIDGSILAQMSFPTMLLPILYAFSYPKRIESDLSKTSILKLPDLTFEDIEKNRYPLFYLCVEAGKKGGIFPTIINATNEAAVQLFLEDKIPFTNIFTISDKMLQKADNIANPDIDTIFQVNKEYYTKVISEYKTLIN